MKLASLVLASSLFTLCTFQAKANLHIENECNVNIHANLRLLNDTIAITTDSGDEIFIDDNRNVSVNGKALSLSAQQEQDIAAYADAILTAAPLAVDIASDGIEIASQALSEVFGTLFGANDSLTQESLTMLQQLNDSLDETFHDSDGAITIQGSDFQHGGWLDNQWNNEFADKVDNIVAKAMGKVALKIGALLLSSDDEAQETLSRLENFDTDFEEIMEQKANLLEDKGVALCDTLLDAEVAEKALQASAKEFADLDIISVD